MWERNTSYVLRFSLLKDGELQLQALYAIQELVHRLEHPTKLLHTILERLYDLELISEESMIEWEKSTDPEEQKGKGVALKSCTQFFKWLKEAEEEGEEEGKVSWKYFLSFSNPILIISCVFIFRQAPSSIAPWILHLETNNWLKVSNKTSFCLSCCLAEF